MKREIILFLGSVVFVFIGLFLDFAASLKYGQIFVAVLFFDVVSIIFLAFLVFLNEKWIFVSLFFGLVSLYSLIDVILRFLYGRRVFDFF
jgi:hypothetical protein